MEDIKNVHLKGIVNEQDFIKDLKTIRAVERELAIIGEAAHHLQKLKVNFIGRDQIINKRNTLVHQYDAA
ncbi:MAG: HepT-like ribonuclease domain-containing protein, partial [Bacteroidota bacterium]